MSKKQIHIVDTEEIYDKDQSIEIVTTAYSDSENDDAKITRKYSAKKEGVSANGFYTKEDAVKELNRKFSLNINNNNNTNNLKTEKMKNSIEELNKNLALATKSMLKKCVIEDEILFTSLKRKVKEIEDEISEHDHKKNVVGNKPLAVKKDIPVKKEKEYHQGKDAIAREGISRLLEKERKAVVKKEVPVKKTSTAPTTSSSNKDANKVLEMEIPRHQKHYRLFKMGIDLDEISALTGATRSNIGRDILQYKKGILKLS